MASKVDVYNLQTRAQKELIDFISSKLAIETLTLDYDAYGDVIGAAVRKLFHDDDIKSKYEKFYTVFKPTSLLRVQREIKLFLDKKRDPFNKNELLDMLYSISTLILFLIIREQNDFYKAYISKLNEKISSAGTRFPSFLRDPDKIYTPVLSTVEEIPNNNTPEIKCFCNIEEKIYKMS